MELDLKNTFGNLLLAVLVLLLVARGISLAGDVQPTPLSVVESNSMEPTYNRGDLVFWRPVSMDEVEKGDIVVYSSEARRGEIIIHRVVEIEENGEQKRLITKGDNNNYTDQSGPHYPEPPVTENELLGKPISIGGGSFHIPQIGHLWLWGSAFFSTAIASGLSSGGITMLIPVFTAGIMIILTIIFFTSDEEEEDEEEKIKNLIIEEEKSRIWTVFLILFIAFIFVVVPSTWYGLNSFSVSVGVGEDAGGGDQSYSYARKGESISGNYTVKNPGRITLTHHVQVRGDNPDWVTVDRKNFRTESEGENTVNYTIDVPEDAETGTYREEIVVRHSPFWSLYPQGFVNAFIEGAPIYGVLMLNIFTAFFFTLITLLLMLLISYAIDEYIVWKEYYKTKNLMKLRRKDKSIPGINKISFYKEKIKEKIGKAFDWIRGVDVVDFEPKKPFYASFVGLVSILFYFLNVDLWILFLLVPLSSAVAYQIGCRWRAEIFTSALITSGMIFFFLLFLPVLVPHLGNPTPTNVSLVLQSLAVILLIYVIISPLILFLSYMTVNIIHRYRIKRYPSIVSEEISDI